MKLGRWMALGLTLLLVSTPASAKKTNQELADDVRAAETAFAKTMADRDLKAFATFVSEETIFFGGKGPLRGRAKVVEVWTRFYEGPAAPFSWKPETVEVLDSGTLALSSGPVFDPDGKLINTFSSIWRLEKDGKWRVIFDKGCPVCEPETKP
ncbi:MAG TPA: nuclear transport factor 2 family protein [Candidatus Eisenbacteria bacterium]|nr:nuclear transport factor 2 family protein [Candidatus Eisenbacteria bacterium]